jgi:hypothetical protein
MGVIKDTKASAAAQHAARAAQEGRTVLLYRQNVGATSSGFSGPVGDVAEVIEAIEGQGWELAQLAYDERQSRHGGVLLLFRAAPAVLPAADDHDAYYQADSYDAYYQDVPSESYQDVPSGRHSHRRE